MFSEFELKNATAKERAYRITENTKSRNKGRLVFEVKPSGAKYFYFQSFKDGKRSLKKIGTYIQTDKVNGITLAQAREKLNEMSSELARIDDDIDYKTHLKLKELAKMREKRKQAEQGTFSALLFCYVAQMRRDGKTSWDQVRKDLYRYVYKPHGQLMDLKANEIKEDDIINILSTMIAKGVTTKTNRIRSYLNAAFNVGAKTERDPLMRARQYISFNLKTNPVSLVPRQESFERVGERYLSASEIKLLWDKSEEELGVVVACILKFAMATGLRAGHEILTLKWSYLDEHEGLLDIPITKSKKSFVIPLNEYALETLERVRPYTFDSPYIFASGWGKLKNSGTHFRTDSLGSAVAKFCKKAPMNKFVPRDIRRTVKTHMGKAGIDKYIRDRLQNHALNDVSSKHYDRYDYLEEKRRAVRIWNEYLRGVLHPKSNVALLTGGRAS